MWYHSLVENGLILPIDVANIVVPHFGLAEAVIHIHIGLVGIAVHLHIGLAGSVVLLPIAGSP